MTREEMISTIMTQLQDPAKRAGFILLMFSKTLDIASDDKVAEIYAMLNPPSP